MAIDASLDELARDSRRVDKARACGREVERRGARRTEPPLQLAGRRGDHAIRRERREDDEIDRSRLDPGIRERHARGRLRERRDRHIRRRDAARMDARA